MDDDCTCAFDLDGHLVPCPAAELLAMNYEAAAHWHRQNHEVRNLVPYERMQAARRAYEDHIIAAHKHYLMTTDDDG